MDSQAPLTSQEEDVRLAGEAERGVRARAMIESAIFREVLEAIEEATIHKFKTAPVRDAEGMLALRLKWQILQEIRGYLTDVANTGKLAEAQIEQKAELAKRKRAADRR